MCVIMVANLARPTEEMIDRAWDKNDDGAGIAWREKNSKGEVEVHFRKGIMDLEIIKALCFKVPLPYVVHFRIASVGGKCESLTHPFPVSKRAPLMLAGHTKGCVLFHNGHWNGWNDKALDAAIHSNTPLPDGDWSDTRAMAWLVSLYGPSVMDMLSTQRGVLFSPTETSMFTGPGWFKINEVWCSNDYFWKKPVATNYNYGSMCSKGTCTKPRKVGGHLCIEHDAERVAKEAAEKAKTTTALATTKPTTTGGTPNNVTPFPQAQAEMLDLPAVLTLHRQGEVSKSMLKKFRQDFDRIQSKDPKVVAKATQRIIRNTGLIREKLLNGYVH